MWVPASDTPMEIQVQEVFWVVVSSEKTGGSRQVRQGREGTQYWVCYQAGEHCGHL